MIADSYADAAISGSSMILRPAVQKLLADAQAGKFDIVVAEALDRVSRDQADVATFYKHLQFARVPLVTLAEGEISELHVGLKGTMNALFLKDLAKKTHRGLRGRVEKGFSARSEEHTSELQSLMRISYAVFCLKKKKPKYTTHT